MKVERLELIHLRLPLVHFFETSFGRVHDHEVLLVRAESQGMVGWGEVPASAAPRYSYETVHTAWHVIRDFLAPKLKGREFSGPGPVSELFAAVRGHNMAKAAVPKMKKGGSIVMTGSVTGLLGSKHLLDYSLTKGGIHAFARSLASQLVDRGIRVNVVAPGPVWTPLNPADKGRTPKQIAKFGADVPMKRPAQPEELAPAYVFLASNADSSYITGSVLQVMGGETAGA